MFHTLRLYGGDVGNENYSHHWFWYIFVLLNHSILWWLETKITFKNYRGGIVLDCPVAPVMPEPMKWCRVFTSFFFLLKYWNKVYKINKYRYLQGYAKYLPESFLGLKHFRNILKYLFDASGVVTDRKLMHVNF